MLLLLLLLMLLLLPSLSQIDIYIHEPSHLSQIACSWSSAVWLGRCIVVAMAYFLNSTHGILRGSGADDEKQKNSVEQKMAAALAAYLVVAFFAYKVVCNLKAAIMPRPQECGVSADLTVEQLQAQIKTLQALRRQKLKQSKKANVPVLVRDKAKRIKVEAEMKESMGKKAEKRGKKKSNRRTNARSTMKKRSTKTCTVCRKRTCTCRNAERPRASENDVDM